MKKQITITIEGEEKTRKSYLVYLIKEILKVHGFRVNFNPTLNYEDEKTFNYVMRSIDSESLSEQVNINIIEKHKITK